MNNADILTVEKITTHLRSGIPPEYIRLYPVLASTNDTAKELALSGAPPGTVVIAAEQTSGKGRMGRKFYSPPDSGIYLSMILRPHLSVDRLLLLTTGVAVAGAQAIEQVCERKIQIKWVNDLYAGGKKIAGILTEASGDGHVIVGIGVNVNESAEGFPGELAEKAGVLSDAGQPVSRCLLLAGLIDSIWQMSGELGKPSGDYVDRLLAEARKRSCVLGRELRVEGYAGLTTARAEEIDEHGFLVVVDGQGTRHVLNSGEISLRI